MQKVPEANVIMEEVMKGNFKKISKLASIIAVSFVEPRLRSSEKIESLNILKGTTFERYNIHTNNAYRCRSPILHITMK